MEDICKEMAIAADIPQFWLCAETQHRCQFFVGCAAVLSRRKMLCASGAATTTPLEQHANWLSGHGTFDLSDPSN